MNINDKAIKKIKHDQKCLKNMVFQGPQGIPGPTGPAGIDGENNNHYALIRNTDSNIGINTTIPLTLLLAKGTPEIIVENDTITLPGGVTYYIAYTLTGRIGSNQTASLIPRFNGVLQDQYYSIQNTNASNNEITVHDGILIPLNIDTNIQFYYNGNIAMDRANFFISIFQISIP